jgi:hypothetical protein
VKPAREDAGAPPDFPCSMFDSSGKEQFSKRIDEELMTYPNALHLGDFTKVFPTGARKQLAVDSGFLFFTPFSYTITSHSPSVLNKGITMGFYR